MLYFHFKSRKKNNLIFVKILQGHKCEQCMIPRVASQNVPLDPLSLIFLSMNYKEFDKKTFLSR